MNLDSFCWCTIFENIFSDIISGLILIGIGVIIYKQLRKKQTIEEAVINKEIKIQYIVNEYKRIRAKYTKPLTEDSISTQIEQEVTDLYGICNETIEYCKLYNIEVESDLKLLMNLLFAKKGVLYTNNPITIANEKIPLFQNMNKMKLSGINYNNEESKKVYFKIYTEAGEEIETLIKNNIFFKKYWN